MARRSWRGRREGGVAKPHPRPETKPRAARRRREPAGLATETTIGLLAAHRRDRPGRDRRGLDRHPRRRGLRRARRAAPAPPPTPAATAATVPVAAASAAWGRLLRGLHLREVLREAGGHDLALV